MSENSQKNFVKVEIEIQKIQDRREAIEDRIFTRSQARNKEKECKLFEREYGESHLKRMQQLDDAFDRYELSFLKEKNDLFNKLQSLKEQLNIIKDSEFTKD